MEMTYTVEEIAEQLKVSAYTVRRWLKDRSLPGIKFGKLWRVQESDLEEFLRSRMSGGEQVKEEAK